MNILHISYHSSPLSNLGLNDGGGLSTYVHELCNVLSRENAIQVISTEYSSNKIKNNYSINTYSHLSSEANMEEKIENIDFFYSDFISSYTEKEITKFDIIHAHYWLSGLVARKIKQKYNIPFVYTSHSLGLFNKDEINVQHRISEEKKIMIEADSITASSYFELNFINKHYDIPKSKIINITPGVNKNVFFPNKEYKTSGKKKIFCVGRIQEQKGQHLVLNFMKLLEKLNIDYHIYFVGEPSGERGVQYFQKIKKEIKENEFSNRSTFLGSLSQDSLARELRDSDLLLHTSEFETFGLIAIEANACGVPVLTINKGSMNEIVSNNINGFITNDFINDEIIEFINHLFKNDQELILIKKKSFEKSKEFLWEKTGEDISKLYKNLV